MSSWLWTSMNPGLTAWPPASSSTPPHSRTVPISTMRSPCTATSARKPGAPLPSYTVPPRITRSNALGTKRSPLEIDDAVGDDADELIHLLASDTERGRQSEHRAPRVDDRPALPRLSVQLRDPLGIEGSARAIWLDEVDADHHASPAHLAYDRPFAHGRLEAVEQTGPHLLGVLDEIVLLHDLEVGERGRAGHGVRRIRVRVHVFLRRAIGE